MKLQLRDYQQRDISFLRNEYGRGRRAPLYVLPTGGGKTVIFTHIAEQAALKGSSVYILVHRQELLTQASRHLLKLGVQHGRISPGHSMTRDKIQVASVQTLVRRMKHYAEPDLLIVDEAHHSTAGCWRKIIAGWPNAKLLGVTATPMRLDGAGLGMRAGGVYDSMLVGPSIRELIDRGFLTQPIVYAPKTQLDLNGLRIRAGDYEKGELEKRVDKPAIIGSAVEHYRRLCDGVPAIAFCASVKHAQHVAEQFRAAGFRSVSLDGTMSDVARKAAIDALGRGEIDVLTSCDIVSEGTDLPIVGAAILLRPTTSEGLFIQQCGRALRPYPGKDKTIILDHVGNCIRHGLPDEERLYDLDGIRRKKRKKKDDEKDIRARRCPKCYCVHVPANVCPVCGHRYETQTRKVETKEGELRQITPAEREAITRQRKMIIGQARSLEDLKVVAKKLGYNPYWADKIYKARMRKGGL